MAATTQRPTKRPESKTSRPIVTRITNKFQTTVPPELRDRYGLREGDFIEWRFDRSRSELILALKRAHLITPEVEADLNELKESRAKEKQLLATA